MYYRSIRKQPAKGIGRNWCCLRTTTHALFSCPPPLRTMSPRYLPSFLLSAFSLSLFSSLANNGGAGVYAYPSNYANAFVDPRFILNKSAWSPNSTFAQKAIVSGAQDYINQEGLGTTSSWSVVNKTILAPTKNPHDYLSFAPYYWPDCSNVHNKTELTQDQIWTECKYGGSYFHILGGLASFSFPCLTQSLSAMTDSSPSPLRNLPLPTKPFVASLFILNVHHPRLDIRSV